MLCISKDYNEISRYFDISFITKDQLSRIKLWFATSKLDNFIMLHYMQKEINQEERYCVVTKQMIKETLAQNELVYLNHFPDGEDLSMIRFISLHKNIKNKGMLPCYDINGLFQDESLNDTKLLQVKNLSAVQFKDSDERSPLLPPDSFHFKNSMSISNIIDARNLYNRLTEY